MRYRPYRSHWSYCNESPITFHASFSEPKHNAARNQHIVLLITNHVDVERIHVKWIYPEVRTMAVLVKPDFPVHRLK